MDGIRCTRNLNMTASFTTTPGSRRRLGVVLWRGVVVLGMLCLGSMMQLIAAEPKADYPIAPLPFTAVKVSDGFWLPRIETNRKVTVRYDFAKCEETGRIDNFAKAGGLMKGPFRGIFFNDSDVFKVIEGASYSLALHRDAKLDEYLDALIVKIAAAQEDDGYLYTARTLNPDNPPGGSGKTRWSHLAHGHELYNVGHMYEAAVAHWQATGKRTLLDVAIKNADLIDRTFGPGKRRDVPGHEEIEIGLVKLYRATGEERYLKLARFFIDQRGRPDRGRLYGAYAQDHKPVVEQTEAVGHAVRAGYLYSGIADVGALTGDAGYVKAIDRIWNDVVSRKLYITGGIGSSRGGEAFGQPYDLANATAYNETCAAIANGLWNHRMFLLHGDAKYIDVLERVIYNGFLSGISLSGDLFFYPNPLAFDGQTKFNQGAAGRKGWFNCSCCPVNVVRFIPSIAGYIYARRDDSVYVNLFIGSTGTVKLAGKLGGDNTVTVSQQTRYPWDGRVRITVKPEREAEFTLRVRIPGWARNRPVPSDLYRYATNSRRAAKLRVNGEPLAVKLERGYAVIRRTWKAGDAVELDLPMPVRRVLSHAKVAANRGRVALERGPIVYCVEAVDNGGKVVHLALPDDAQLKALHRPDLLGGITVLAGDAVAVSYAKDGKTKETTKHRLVAIPYYAWAHRQLGEMAVWLPRDVSLTRPTRPPTIASQSRATASHTWHLDTAAAMNDLVEPANSSDQSIRRLTFWDHLGSKEWVQYELKQPTKVSGVAVYWFDDSGIGGCRVPESWRLLYRDGKTWKPVEASGEGGVSKDKYNRLKFKPVTTVALRLEIQLRKEFSAGVLEWKVE